ncbi:MAG: ribonuclease P protein component [Pseudomonadota bacterium]
MGAKSLPPGARAAGNVSPPDTGTGRIVRLVHRSSFLRAAKGARVVKPAFVLQVRRREDGPDIGIGFTASRRVGNAVKRNRARRRLKEVARQVLPQHAMPGHDYVLVARGTTGGYPFATLGTDLVDALRQSRARSC